jgi:hypothetical protein
MYHSTKKPRQTRGFLCRVSANDHFTAGGCSPDVSTVVVFVFVVEPSGVVTVVEFLTSDFFSHPAIAHVEANSKQMATICFMVQSSLVWRKQ